MGAPDKTLLAKKEENHTCGCEAWAYCQTCKRGVIFMCLDGLISCPICKLPVQWCPVCADGAELEYGAALEAISDEEEDSEESC